MRDKIAKIVLQATDFSFHHGQLTLDDIEDYVFDIMKLIAPELEKAEKWDTVMKLAEYQDKPDCKGYPLQIMGGMSGYLRRCFQCR